MFGLIDLAAQAVVVLLVCYVIVMHYKHRRERRGSLRWFEWVIVAPFLVVGWPLDVALQYTLAVILWGDMAQEHTISGRVDRYLVERTWQRAGGIAGVWRRGLTRAVAWLLNRVDPEHVG